MTDKQLKTPRPSELPVNSYWNIAYGDFEDVCQIIQHKNGAIYARAISAGIEIKLPRKFAFWELFEDQQRKHIPPTITRMRATRPLSMCPAFIVSSDDPRYKPWRDIMESYPAAFINDNVYFRKNQLFVTMAALTGDLCGNQPFLVAAYKDAIEIYGDEHPLIYDEQPIYNVLIRRYTEFEGVWFGKDTSCYNMVDGDNYVCRYGGTMLIKLSDTRYVYISGNVVEFDILEDPITNFVSCGLAWSDGDSIMRGNVYFLEGDMRSARKSDLFIPCTAYTSMNVCSELCRANMEKISNVNESNELNELNESNEYLPQRPLIKNINVVANNPYILHSNNIVSSLLHN